MMITTEAQRMRVMKRLQETRRNETVCLWGWETEIITEWIAELEERLKGVEQEVKTE